MCAWIVDLMQPEVVSAEDGCAEVRFPVRPEFTLQEHPFDVVFLDIKMPGMELQEHIHRIDPEIAVIMITAFASVETAVRALKPGAFDYVTKPIEPDKLIARAVHANSQRRYFPIVPVNCGALPENLLESELFGHEKGAFTGAQHRRKGKIEMARGDALPRRGRRHRPKDAGRSATGIGNQGTHARRWITDDQGVVSGGVRDQ